MAYSPHLKQAEAHRAFLVDGYKRGTIFWGRRVGKSTWSRWHLIIAALLKQGPYWVVFDTREHAKEVMWDALLNDLPKGVLAEKNSTTLILKFHYVQGKMKLPGIGEVEIRHDTSKEPSTIQLTGSDTADADRGNEAQGILFDEYQDQDSTKWRSVYEPFLATTQGWACFMGTAKGYNHWYKLMEKSKQRPHWFHSEGTWRDVTSHIIEGRPMITPEWIAESRKEAEMEGELDTWLQEYELAFNNPAKAVYPMFKRDIHIIEPTDPRLLRDMTWYGVWDFGFAEGHPMAFNMVGIDGEGKWYVTDEIHGTGIYLDDMIERIRTVIGNRRVLGIVADCQRPDAIETARSKGLPVIPSPKGQGTVQSGILLLAGKLKPKIQMHGGPQPDFFVSSNCKHTIEQMENYSYKESEENRPKDENPLKVDDDHPDAIRYLALFLKYGLGKKRDNLGSPAKTNAYGIPL